ncbi:hypothetical protein SAMN05421866_3483 [Chryseobacterium oranimense]|uniref:Uncharacterized protein n=1 Tax=Chryseobacterium oranimense TaxID=421058 RepID=A0A1M5V0P9_9FLAO|nr:hypothetical protein SAMN05421866_3483 [Chryseobacterium oranimense]
MDTYTGSSLYGLPEYSGKREKSFERTIYAFGRFKD